MKQILFAVFLFIPFTRAISQSLPETLRTLDRRGLNFNIDYYADISTGSGGAPQSSTVRAVHFFDVAATLTTSRLVPQWRGGAFVASFHHTSQTSPTSRGEFQAISSIEDLPRNVISELYFEQSLNTSLRLRAGKLDANHDFGFLENGIDFLNLSTCYTPTAFLFPTFADTRWGAEVLFNTPRAWANVAVFTSGPGTHVLTEAGLRWSPSGLSGRAAIGLWHDSNPLIGFSGTSHPSTSGLYLLAEQRFFRREHRSGAEQTVAAFVQLGGAPEDLSPVRRNLTTGVVGTGLFAGRAADSAGTAFYIAQLTREPAANLKFQRESAFEVFYRFRVTSSISLTPDLQYLLHAGGLPDSRNALVVGARLKFNFNTHRE